MSKKKSPILVCCGVPVGKGGECRVCHTKYSLTGKIAQKPRSSRRKQDGLTIHVASNEFVTFALIVFCALGLAIYWLATHPL